MSESESSITWSGSVESYFSSDSSSMHCPMPRRLMDLIADKFKLMKCVSREKASTAVLQVEPPKQVEEQSKNLHPQRMAYLLREKLERLNAEREDEDLPERSPRRVKFPDLSTSPSLSLSNLNVDQVQVDIHVPSSSHAFLPPSNRTANAAVDNIPENVVADMMLTEQEKSIFVLNFPEINMIVDSVSDKECD